MTRDEINAEARRIVTDAGVSFDRGMVAFDAIVALATRLAGEAPKSRWKSEEMREKMRRNGMRLAMRRWAGHVKKSSKGGAE